MRDAFGGAFMIRLLIVFIVLYVSFTAIALNYAKAFKVKNKVIQYIEDNEIADVDAMPAHVFEEMDRYIEEVTEKMGYSIDTIDCTSSDFYCENGILIVPHEEPAGSNKKGTYYTVTTAFGWSIPFLNVILRLNDQNGETTIGRWTISGETRTIVNGT